MAKNEASVAKNDTLMFFIGFFSSALLLYSVFYLGTDIPLISGGGNIEVPGDWISEEDIIVGDEVIILKISGATISNYAPTGSMRPLLDEGANGIRIVPGSEADIGVGDIVSFIQDNKMTVHRIVGVGSDELGIYYITQGYNNLAADEKKLRFSDIKYVTIGILW